MTMADKVNIHNVSGGEVDEQEGKGDEVGSGVGSNKEEQTKQTDGNSDADIIIDSCTDEKRKTKLSYTAPAQRMKSRTSRRRRDYDSEKDQGKIQKGVIDEKQNARLSYDAPTHRMNRRRHDDDSDDEDEDDDAYEDDSCSQVNDDDDNRTRRSNGESLGTPSNSDIYNSVGAVAVNPNGLLVSQSPAVLTQPDIDSTINEEIFAKKHDRAVKDSNMSNPSGDGKSSTIVNNNIEGYIDAQVENLTVAETTIGPRDVHDIEKAESNKIMLENDGKQEESIVLPWYRSRLFLGVVGTLIVALGVVVAIVLVRGGEKSNPTPSPTIAPTISLDSNFERYIVREGNISSIDMLLDQSSPQFKAYRWLAMEDAETKFSDKMSEDEIAVMKTRYVLAVFFYALRGKDWLSSNYWLDGSRKHCLWEQVYCEDNNKTSDNNRPVTGLRLVKNNLDGTIPSELVHLSNIDLLELYENNIKSVNGLVGMESLKYLRLRDNPLENHEDLFNLTNLELLDLGNTGLSGTLSSEVQKLSKLINLDLSQNKLSGRLTNQFQMMSNLRYLLMGQNEFEGTLEDILNCGNCTNTLERFTSNQNALSGEIPNRLFDFSKLSLFRVMDSKLTGTIPSGIGQMTALTELNLQQNTRFSESNTLPTELGNLTNLKALLLSGSTIGGTIPLQLGNLSKLTTLALVQTSLSGSIADGICEIDGLSIMYSSEITCSCPDNKCQNAA